MPTALEICRHLVGFRSVTPRDDGALAFVGDLLTEAGFEIHRVALGDAGTTRIENLFARIGSGSPAFVFAGHTDVVPPGDVTQWRYDPFSATIADGFLYGRGASDMKGGLAASLAAAASFIAAHGIPKGSIAFLLTGDEEGPAINGTVKLLVWARDRGEVFDHCILAEPTSRQRLGDTMKIGRRGSLTGELTVHGKQGHVAYPELADNPIPPLLRLLNRLTASPLDEGSERFDPSNLEITSVDVGNAATNVIPAAARARFNIRFNDRWNAQTLEQELRERLADVASNVRFDLEFFASNAPAFATEPGPFVDLVARAVESETGRRPELSTSGGTSDARFIRAFCPVVELGPVGETMHAVDECIDIGDLSRLTRIYERILKAYFADGPGA